MGRRDGIALAKAATPDVVAQHSSEGRPARILVVDDEGIVASALRMSLRRMGYEVTGIADSAETALACVERSRPDLVLMDIHIRGPIDGIELARSLREKHDIPSIYLTAYADPETVSRAELAAPYGYLMKPYEDRALRAAVEIALHNLRLDRERKRAEERLEESSHELDRRVEQRTRELAQTTHELEAFTHYVAHDLRAPIRRIRVLADELRDEEGKLDAGGREIVGRLVTESDRLMGLVSALLEFSRSVQAEISRQPVDLSAIALGVVEELRRRDPAREVSVAVDPGLVADADPALARILIENLVGNAWKYTAGAARATIRFRRLDDAAQGDPTFVVEDNGVGFDARAAGRLFTPFQRLHSSAEFPGTGLGLSSVRRIVERHGGVVWAEGEPGRGARFYFTLPGPSAKRSPSVSQ